METRTLLSGMAIGAAAALMFDPARGARRRALMRDKAIRASRVTGEVLDTTFHDMVQRTEGIAAETWWGWMTDRHVDDRRLRERVRARLGRVCSHPGAIDAEVQDGQVTLAGPILAVEVHDVMSTVAAVRGVGSVINELEPYDSPDGVPALQGEGRVGGLRFDLLQPHWASATRALVGAAAVAAGGLAWRYARR